MDLGDPAALGAVTLAMGLLHSRLKAEATARGAGRRAAAMDRRGEAVRAMADPFVPLLTRYGRVLPTGGMHTSIKC